LSKRVISIQTNGVYLCEKNKQLEIWHKEERLSSVPLEELGILFIENPACTLTGKLLQSLGEVGAVVSICDQYHLPSSLLLPLQGVSIHASRTRALAELTKPKKGRAWQHIISCKIRFQAQVVQNDSFVSGLLLKMSEGVTPGDIQNCEATSARYYWSVVFKEYQLDFKRSGENEINGYLNYGYAVTRAAIARSLIAIGLNPVFGVFHRSRDNSFALVDDLLEIYRPFVDLFVRKLLARKEATLKGQAFKREVLRILTSRIKMQGEIRPFLAAIDLTVGSFLGFIECTKHKLEFPDVCEFQDID